MERAPAPEADATRTLYERYAGQIYGFCLHRLGSREDAEDAVQQTFLNAFRGLRRGVVPEAESAWLFKIAENVCLTRHRSAWRRGRVESPSDMQALQDVTPARERNGDELIPLGDALSAMPEAQRRAILLREWQGLSYKEIASEMDVSQSAVETLIFRARRSLANALETPWRDRRTAARTGRRAFDVSWLLAGLKTLFAGGTAAKVAAVTVAATGTAALAVAEGRHPDPAKSVQPSVAAVRAPDSARSGPVALQPSEAVLGVAPAETKPSDRGSRSTGAKFEQAAKSKAAAPETSNRPETPPGQAKDPGTRANPPGHAKRSQPAAKPKAKAKVKAKPARTTRRSSRPAPKPRPAQAQAPKPKPTPPRSQQPNPAPPPPPPPPPSPPPGPAKDKTDKE